MSDVPHVCLLGSSSEDIADRYDSLLAALAAAGARVSVISDGEISAIGVESSVLPHGIVHRRGVRSALVPLLVARWSQDLPTVLHVLTPDLVGVAVAAANTVGVPFRILTLPTTFEASRYGARRFVNTRNRLALAKFRRSAAHIDKFVALHAGAKSSWTALGIAAEEDVLLLDSGMGVPVEPLLEARDKWRTQTRSEWGVADDQPVVTYVHDSRAAADQTAIAAVFKRIRQELPTECRFASLGQQAPEGVTALANGEARRRWLAGADIVVSLARAVDQAVPVQEAAALSVPAVVSRVKGHSEIVRHEHTGLVVPTGDYGAASDACLRLLRKPKVRLEFGSRARSYAARLHDRDLAVQKVLRLYDQILGGPKAEPAHLTADGGIIGASARDLVG